MFVLKTKRISKSAQLIEDKRDARTQGTGDKAWYTMFRHREKAMSFNEERDRTPIAGLKWAKTEIHRAEHVHVLAQGQDGCEYDKN